MAAEFVAHTSRKLLCCVLLCLTLTSLYNKQGHESYNTKQMSEPQEETYRSKLTMPPNQTRGKNVLLEPIGFTGRDARI